MFLLADFLLMLIFTSRHADATMLATCRHFTLSLDAAAFFRHFRHAMPPAGAFITSRYYTLIDFLPRHYATPFRA